MAVGTLLSANSQRKAAKDASRAQVESSELGIEEQRRQFDLVQKLLAPYVSAGTGALTKQQDLLGLNGRDVQDVAYREIESSPAFKALTEQGEEAILANASATGGLRGGNTQGALAEFRPQLLAQLIEQQYSRLGGLTSIGQNAAAGVGNAGMHTGDAVTRLLGEQGASRAGASLAKGRIDSQAINSLASIFGQYMGASGGSGPSNGSVDNTLF